MIGPLNFAAQAVRDLRTIVDHPRVMDKEAISTLAKVIEISAHFQLPDGGRILDDKLKGLHDEILRLPYPSITVEYRVPIEMHVLTPETPQMCTKRMAVALEFEVGDPSFERMISMVGESERQYLSDGAINIVVVDYLHGRWIPLEAGWIMPSRWYSGSFDNGEPRITGYPYTFLSEMFERTLTNARGKGQSDEAIRSGMVRDLWDEVCAVLALLEALSCSNVRAEPIQRSDPKLNARRARDGKLPLYEVKVLTVDAPGSSGERRSLGGHHASPRQHLRRGHVRRRNGKKFWVNSHLVGDPSRGKVVKSYDVRRSSDGKSNPKVEAGPLRGQSPAVPDTGRDPGVGGRP